MKHIVLTGGGPAGHVTPNIALLPSLKNLDYKISYIGQQRYTYIYENHTQYQCCQNSCQPRLDKSFSVNSTGERKKLIKHISPPYIKDKE